MIDPMHCPCDSPRLSSTLASLLLLALAACAPKSSDTQSTTGTQTASSSGTTDDSSAGPGTSGSGSTTDPGSTWTSATATMSTATSGVTTTGSCATVDCAPCWAVADQDCSCCAGDGQEIGDCGPLHGTRLDREQGCIELDAYAVCAEQICSAIGTVYQGPDGTCWSFSGDCLGEGNAEGWTLDQGGSLCPEFADPDTYWPPPC